MKPTLTQIQLALQAQSPNPVWVKERKARAKPKHVENDLQVQCVKLLRSLPATLAFSVPNHIGYGGKNSGARIGFMARQKAMGLLPGVSDLIVMYIDSYGEPAVLCLELKSEKGSLSESQQNFAALCDKVGADFYIIRSLDDLVATLRKESHPSI